MKDVQAVALLLDFYGPLLTERQQEWMQAYYLEDHSLAEIAGAHGISRQAVHDLVKRSEAALTEYEQRLGFVREYKERQALLQGLEEAMGSGEKTEMLRLLTELKGQ